MSSPSDDSENRSDDAGSNPEFVELTCPACHAVSDPIPLDDRISQRTFDDVHRRCYINAAPRRQD